MKWVLVYVLLAAYFPRFSTGHGRLLDPPGRSSLWRDPRYQTDPSFQNAVVNYNDNGLNCGGYQNQWEVNQGKCGICGDPWQGPRDHEPPNGRYAKGIISRDFDEGSVIVSKVQVTADHKGYFEFRLCPNNDISKPVTQECLDETVLKILNASEEKPTRYYTHGTDFTTYDLHLQLPRGIYGDQVVLQWKYHTGNSWGCDSMNCCISCGEVQEEFYACADILIRPTFPTSTPEQTTHPTPSERICTANAQWKDVAGMDNWCKANCIVDSTCPQSHCICTGSKTDQKSGDSFADGQTCTARGLWHGNSAMDKWCANNCPRGACPADICLCS